MCSIGFKSGDLGGSCVKDIPESLMAFKVSLEVWILAQSWTKVHFSLEPFLIFSWEKMNFSRVWIYLAEFVVYPLSGLSHSTPTSPSDEIAAHMWIPRSLYWVCLTNRSSHQSSSSNLRQNSIPTLVGRI